MIDEIAERLAECKGRVGQLATVLALPVLRVRGMLQQQGLVAVAEALRAEHGIAGPRMETAGPREPWQIERDHMLEALEATATMQADAPPEQRVLQCYGWHPEKAAERLEWTRRTFYRRLDFHGLLPTHAQKREALILALMRCDGNCTRLAAYLHVAAQSVSRYMRVYQIDAAWRRSLASLQAAHGH